MWLYRGFWSAPMKGETIASHDRREIHRDALPYGLWGLLSESWRPDPTNDVTVFLQALEKRGPDSRHPAQQIGLENAGLSGL